MVRFLLALALSLAAAVPMARAAEPDTAVLDRLSAYLAEIQTLKARFTQIDSNGGLAEGTLYLRRPGRLRFEYDPPVPLLIVADGVWLSLYDTEINHVDRLPLWQTPISVLVDDEVDLAGDDRLVVERTEVEPGAIRVTLSDPLEPEQGRLVLVFQDGPLALRRWEVLDAIGGRTTVALFEVETGLSLSPALFPADALPDRDGR